MFHAALFACIFSSAAAVRIRTRRSRSWTTTADRTHGPCTAYLGRGVSAVIGGTDNLPVAMPLMCTGEATNVALSATSYGHTSALLVLEVDGQEKGSLRFPWWQSAQHKTLDVSLGTLASGLHIVRFSGSKLDFKNVTLQGSGGSCSFDEADGWDAAQFADAYTSWDVLNRLFGPDQNFAMAPKKEHYFASKSVGTTDEISTAVVAQGIWQWFLAYSQNASSRDEWGHKWEGLWDESKDYPHQTISLEYAEGRNGQTMKIYESCNALSNLVYAEAATWSSCKTYSFTRDEHASVMAAFSGLAAGSAFLHSCGCTIGGKTDTFTMDWLLLQSYQIMVRETIAIAGDDLTEEERNAVLGYVPLGTQPVIAVDVAKDMTRLFSGKYDRDFWNATLMEYDIPDYMFGICGVISYTVYALKGAGVLPSFLEGLIDDILAWLLGQFFNDAEGAWLQNTYLPAAKKALDKVTVCGDGGWFSVDPLLSSFIKFCVTFVEALMYQEAVIEPPAALEDLLRWLEGFGVTSDLIADMPRVWDLYNGDPEDCLSRSRHAVWHERAGHGLLHLLDMADQLSARTKQSSDQC